MHAFLCTLAPRSVNARKKKAYYDSIADSFRRYCGGVSPECGSLYGIVYYFYRNRTDLDADNISKPIWDALKEVAYTDDKQIRFRSSGICDLGAEELQVLDLTSMPDSVVNDFLELVDRKNAHILYVELGEFKHKLFRFGNE